MDHYPRTKNQWTNAVLLVVSCYMLLLCSTFAQQNAWTIWCTANVCSAGRKEDHLRYFFPDLPLIPGRRYWPLKAKIKPIRTISFFKSLKWWSSTLENKGIFRMPLIAWFTHEMRSSSQSFWRTPCWHATVVVWRSVSGSNSGSVPPPPLDWHLAFAFALALLLGLATAAFRFLEFPPDACSLHTTDPDITVKSLFINDFFWRASKTQWDEVSSSSNNGTYGERG